jgi:hypothetical protein
VDQVARGPSGGDPDDRAEDFVVDHHALGRVLGRVAVGGHDHGDRLADVVHLVAGQRVLGAGVREIGVRDQQRQRVGQPPGQVVPGVDRHQALDVEGARHVDAADAGVCVGAADEGDRQRVVAGVVEEAARAPEQALILPALDRLAEPAGGHGGPSAASSAARRTERTMLT